MIKCVDLRFLWLALACLLGTGHLLAQADPSGTVSDEPAAASGLRVEQVFWKPDGKAGGIIEVKYRLIDVRQLPKHPSVTYVLHESGEKLSTRRMPMLPPTVSDPDKAPLASFSVRDEQGIVRPGQRVTVVIAGLTEAGILVEGEAVSASQSSGAAGDEPSGGGSLEVVKLMLSGNGYLLDLRYRLSGVERLLADADDTYILKPETGQRLRVLGVTRIGTLATREVGRVRTAYLVVKNPERAVEAGDRVTVVVAGIEKENVLVEE